MIIDLDHVSLADADGCRELIDRDEFSNFADVAGVPERDRFRLLALSKL